MCTLSVRCCCFRICSQQHQAAANAKFTCANYPRREQCFFQLASFTTQNDTKTIKEADRRGEQQKKKTCPSKYIYHLRVSVAAWCARENCCALWVFWFHKMCLMMFYLSLTHALSASMWMCLCFSHSSASAHNILSVQVIIVPRSNEEWSVIAIIQLNVDYSEQQWNEEEEEEKRTDKKRNICSISKISLQIESYF